MALDHIRLVFFSLEDAVVFESHVRMSADIPEVVKIITVASPLSTIFTLTVNFTSLFKPLLWRGHWNSILMIRTLKNIVLYQAYSLLILCVASLICVFLH